MNTKPEALRLADAIEAAVEVGRYSVGGVADCAAAELRRQHAALRAVYEVWAGSEAFEPVTAAEGYLLQLVKQMRDAAMEELK